MTTERAFCTECGTRLDDGAKFCAGCGHVVQGIEVTPTAPSSEPAATVVPTAAPSPTTAVKKARPRWRKKRYWIPAVLLIAIAIIGSTSGGNKKPATSDNSNATAASSGTDVAASAPAKPRIPQSLKDARSYINHHAREINTVQVMVQSVQVAVGLAQKSASQTTIDQLAQIAQQAHDSIDNVRQNFALYQFGSGALSDAELEVFDAANKLKNSMGAVVAYTGDPNAATLASFTSQYQPAVSEWNEGIRIIWREAHRTKPPVL